MSSLLEFWNNENSIKTVANLLLLVSILLTFVIMIVLIKNLNFLIMDIGNLSIFLVVCGLVLKARQDKLKERTKETV